MATFPDIEPSFSVKKDQAPIGKVVRFADGFEKRLIFGIPNHQNPNIPTSLTNPNIPKSSAEHPQNIPKSTNNYMKIM